MLPLSCTLEAGRPAARPSSRAPPRRSPGLRTPRRDRSELRWTILSRKILSSGSRRRASSARVACRFQRRPALLDPYVADRRDDEADDLDNLIGLVVAVEILRVVGMERCEGRPEIFGTIGACEAIRSRGGSSVLPKKRISSRCSISGSPSKPSRRSVAIVRSRSGTRARLSRSPPPERRSGGAASSKGRCEAGGQQSIGRRIPGIWRHEHLRCPSIRAMSAA